MKEYYGNASKDVRLKFASTGTEQFLTYVV